MTDISDAVSRLQHMNDTLAENDRLRAEIDRLRLTAAEREAVHQAAIRVAALCQRGSQRMADTLRGLLERMGGDA